MSCSTHRSLLEIPLFILIIKYRLSDNIRQVLILFFFKPTIQPSLYDITHTLSLSLSLSLSVFDCQTFDRYIDKSIIQLL